MVGFRLMVRGRDWLSLPLFMLIIRKREKEKRQKEKEKKNVKEKAKKILPVPSV